ncbi:caspase family protein [Sphingobacterium multivorum]|uniref:caspase family protein n=1 Tax=Sphingobacterium multivorum TaxID=28454 RepID=UPI0028A06C77|nr:caspase family protein [Sphingobacterium multivorum]
MSGKNILLTIGISDYVYVDPWHKLPNAVSDCERVSKVLIEKYGFEHIDHSPMADSEAKLESIVDLFQEIETFCCNTDNLIIYFAGHGFRKPESRLHWVPQDGHPYKKDTWLSSSDILDLMELTYAKHVILISDCCYSGLLTTGQPKLSAQNLTNDALDGKYSRIILTSGGNTKVYDGPTGKNSRFCQSLCEILEKNRESQIRFSKVIADVILLTRVRSTQRPQSSQLTSKFNEGGEMILRHTITEENNEKVQYKFDDLPEVGKLISRSIRLYDENTNTIDSLFSFEGKNLYLQNVVPFDRKLVLLGNPGSGKTFQLLKVAKQFQNDESIYVPFYNKLNKYNGGSLKKYLQLDFESIEQNTLILFLDGLDEIESYHREEAISEITRLSSEYPLLGMVISCRTNFYTLPTKENSGMLSGFSVYFLNDLSQEDVKNYCIDDMKIDGDHFLKSCYQGDLQSFLSRPYTLNILLDHYVSKNKLEITRKQILEENSKTSIMSEKDIRLVSKKDYREVEKTVQKLAFIMETMGRNYISDAEVHELFPFDKDYEKLIKVPSLRLDKTEDIWMFTHNNIQEYLAAKILAIQDFNVLIDIISTKSIRKLRIKPSWVNTVSFVSSIIDGDRLTYLFNWISENDPEIIIKFEPERFSDHQRTELFVRIFEYYSSRGQWLHSNKFTAKDISRFGQTGKSIKYLTNILVDPQATEITKLNALYVLHGLDEKKLRDKKIELRNVLVKMLDDDYLRVETINTVIYVIAELKLANEQISESIIEKYKLSKNQYIRAALYRLIVSMDSVDKNIGLIIDSYDIEGMAGAIGERSDTMLIDETLHLSNAVMHIRTIDALNSIIKDLQSSPHKQHSMVRNGRDLFSKIIDRSIYLFKEFNRGIFDILFEFYTTQVSTLDNYVLSELGRFFKETDTKRAAMIDIWKMFSESANLDNLTSYLLDVDSVSEFIDMRIDGNFTDEHFKRLHEILYYQQSKYDNLLPELEQAADDQFGIKLERPGIKNWKEREVQLHKKGIALLLDSNSLLKEVDRIYFKIDKITLDNNDIFDLMYTRNSEEVPTPHAVCNLLRLFIGRDRGVDHADFHNWVLSDSQGFQYQVLKEVKSILTNSKDLDLEDREVAQIQKLCLANPDEIDLVYYFLNRYGLELPEENLIKLINYINPSTDFSSANKGTLDIIENYLDAEMIRRVISEKLQYGYLDLLAWVSYIFYGFRKEWAEFYGYVPQQLINSKREEYKFEEILRLWFDRTQDLVQLKEIIEKTALIYLKRSGIKLLCPDPAQHTFIVGVLIAILNEEYELEEKQEAANLLIEFGELEGFYYLADFILENREEWVDFRYGCRNFSKLTHLSAVPKLMELLFVSKQEDFKKDPYNDLEPIVLEALINIGSQSQNSSVQVSDEINNFMEDHAGQFSHLERLNYIIDRIEANVSNKSMITDVKSALSIFEKLDF